MCQRNKGQVEMSLWFPCFLRNLLVISTIVYYFSIHWNLKATDAQSRLDKQLKKTPWGNVGGSFAEDSDGGKPFLLPSFLVDVYQHHKNQNMMSSWQLLRQNILKLKELVSGMSGLSAWQGFQIHVEPFSTPCLPNANVPRFLGTTGPLNVCHLRPWQQWSDLLPAACEHRGNLPGVRCKNLICHFFFSWKQLETNWVTLKSFTCCITVASGCEPK